MGICLQEPVRHCWLVRTAACLHLPTITAPQLASPPSLPTLFPERFQLPPELLGGGPGKAGEEYGGSGKAGDKRKRGKDAAAEGERACLLAHSMQGGGPRLR